MSLSGLVGPLGNVGSVFLVVAWREMKSHAMVVAIFGSGSRWWTEGIFFYWSHTAAVAKRLYR